jgi:actin-like ATPase involved in cell morphogenesis
MKTLVAVAAGLVLGTAGWAGAHERGSMGMHRGTGIVIAASPSEITMTEGDGVHRIAVDKATRIVIGPEARVRRLGAGDYVAEECVPDGKGGFKAVKIILYRPAWMELASPEN